MTFFLGFSPEYPSFQKLLKERPRGRGIMTSENNRKNKNQNIQRTFIGSMPAQSGQRCVLYAHSYSQDLHCHNSMYILLYFVLPFLVLVFCAFLKLFTEDLFLTTQSPMRSSGITRKNHATNPHKN